MKVMRQGDYIYQPSPSTVITANQYMHAVKPAHPNLSNEKYPKISAKRKVNDLYILPKRNLGKLNHSIPQL